MTIGEMVKSMLVRLEWFDTRFPRIPVNVQVRHTIFISCSYSTGTHSRSCAQEMMIDECNYYFRNKSMLP